MAVTEDEVLHLAKLARLNLSSSDVSNFVDQLSPIVDYFKELNEVDTDGVNETSQTTGLTDVFRADNVDVIRNLSQEKALSEAKNTSNGFFVVPAILNKE